jgi:hypothetical protein
MGETAEIDYISLGGDCMPAINLRQLGLRKEAYPFDWVLLHNDTIATFLLNDFENYHSNLIMNWNRWIKNLYHEIEFPHDYDTTTDDGWRDQIPSVTEKYQRRIERFRNLMKKDTPLIVCMSYNMYMSRLIRQLIKEKYNRQNIYYIVKFKDEELVEDDNIFPAVVKGKKYSLEEWNAPEIWLPAIERVRKIINN